MTKAIIIAKMRTTADRGWPNVGQVGISFVHCGSVELPGAYKAFIVTGTVAQLTAISQHANFLVWQQISKSDEVYAWTDSRTAIAAGAAVKINTWLVNNGYKALTAQNSIVDLIRIFQPGYEPGMDDVEGP